MDLLSLLSYPKIEDIKSALFIQPHPDDNEIGAGGLMCLLSQKGIPVYGLTITQGRGESLDPSLTPEACGKLRQKEANEAMKITHTINLGDLGYHDQNPFTHEKLVEDLVKVIRQVRPQALFTVDDALKNEMHPIHIQVGKAVKEAFMRSGQFCYPYHEQIVHEDAFSPEIIGFYFTDDENTIVDISEVYEQKLQAIKAHHSQIDEATIQLYDQIFAFHASDTPYKRIESYKLLSRVHTHCFALPKSLQTKIK